MEIFWMILIGIVAGWLAGQLISGEGFGLIGDLSAGVIGALIGGTLFEKTGIFTGSSLIGSLIVATTGAIIFRYGVRMVKKA